MAPKRMDDIAAELKEMKFHKKLIGGVDEIDVWKKMDMLRQKYENAQDVQEDGGRPEAESPAQVIRKRRQELYWREDIKSFFIRLALMILILLVLFGYIFGIAPMRDDDMKPRISSGDLMLYYRLQDDPGISDVYVYEKDGVQHVGRVVAQSGDKVEVTKDAKLKINDSLMWEMDIFYTTPQYQDGIDFPVTLKEDEYFILCDYREGGKDSRYFGPVTKEELKGKVIAVLRRSGL